MRWVIVGAGAVGGVVGGCLAAAGHDVVLVARGDHRVALREGGLRLRSPDGERRLRLPVAADPAEVDWRTGDVAVVATKSMDSEAVQRALAAAAPPGTPLVCLQNGVANEPAALRRFADVYGVCVMLPSSHLEPGMVVAHSAPVPGILDLGRFPDGIDATAEELAAGLRSAGFDSMPRGDIMRMKYRKLLVNLGNAVEALCGRVDGLADAERPLVAEGEAVLDAAGIPYASAAEDAERRGDILVPGPVAGVPRDGGSTWQSLARGTGAVEVDYLNGEIVMLGRRHGVPTPANALAQRLVNEAARTGRRPGSLTPPDFLAALART
jgi:2-dehydropantoate 2-reductase